MDGKRLIDLTRSITDMDRGTTCLKYHADDVIRLRNATGQLVMAG